jgi:hypothetical protein
MNANPNLSEIAKARAAALNPKTSSLSVGGALGRTIALWVLFFFTLGWIFHIGLGRALERGFGFYLIIFSWSYIATAARMWYSRLVLRAPMRWTSRPISQVVMAWLGAFIIFSTLGIGRGVVAPFGLHVRFHGEMLAGLIGMIFVYGLILGIPVAAILWGANRRKAASSGLQVHIPQTRSDVPSAIRPARVAAPAAAPAWRLALGVATGYARGRNDEHSFFAGDNVSLSIIDAPKGMLIAGHPGSGKTSLLRKFARQVADLPGTALVALSAKSADARSMAAFFKAPIILGPGHVPFDLFRGLSPENLGECFGSLAGDPKNSFWKAAVGNLSCAWLQICLGLAGETIVVPEQQQSERAAYQSERILSISYSPKSFSDLLYSDDRTMAVALTAAVRKLPTITDAAKAAQMAAGISYFSGEYQATLQTSRGEVLGSTRASISPYLRALCAPGLAEAFGSGDLDLPAAIDGGRAIIVDVDVSKSAAGFMVASSIIFAHLKAAALARCSRAPSRNNPVLVLADEWGSYCSLDTLQLFETSRQSRICCMVSVIALSNLEARLGSSAAFAMPSALGSFVCFATGDQHTRKYVSERIGSIRELELSKGSSSSPHSSAPLVPSTSYSTSERFVVNPIIEDQAWGSLGVNTEAGHASCIAILAQGGGVLHDVIMVPE